MYWKHSRNQHPNALHQRFFHIFLISCRRLGRLVAFISLHRGPKDMVCRHTITGRWVEIEAFIASNILNCDYVNEYDGGAPQVLAMQMMLCNPSIMLMKAQGTKDFRTIQGARASVFLGSWTYQEGFITGYNIAAAPIWWSTPGLGQQSVLQREFIR